MKISRVLLVPFFAFCLAGCIPESKNPLCAPEDSILDTRLSGVWRADSDGDKIYLHFGKDGKERAMGAIEVDHEKDGTVHANSYTVFTTRIEGVNYLNIRAATGENRPYFFARYGIDSTDTLNIWLMSEEPVINAIKADKLKGTVSGEKSSREIKVTDTTANLVRFVRKSDRMVLFAQKFGTFHRVDAGSPPAAKKK